MSLRAVKVIDVGGFFFSFGDFQCFCTCRSSWKGPPRNTVTTRWCRIPYRWWRPCAPASTRPRGRWRSWRFWRNGSPTSKAGRWASTWNLRILLNDLNLLKKSTTLVAALNFCCQTPSWFTESHLAPCRRFKKNSKWHDFCSLLSSLVFSANNSFFSQWPGPNSFCLDESDAHCWALGQLGQSSSGTLQGLTGFFFWC